MTSRGIYNRLFPRLRRDCSECNLPALLLFYRHHRLLRYIQRVVRFQAVCVSFCLDKERPCDNKCPSRLVSASIPASSSFALPHKLSLPPSDGLRCFPTPGSLHGNFWQNEMFYPLFLIKLLLLIPKLKVTSLE